MENFNQTELTILNSLNDFITKAEDWDHDIYWTKSIKEILRDIGSSYKYLTYASGISADWGEYLYDLVWSEYSDSLKNIPLVVEIEWKKDFETELQHDFEKLLITQAELRLFIFQSDTDEIANEYFLEFDKIVDNFKLKQPGDRYLYLCLSHPNSESVKFLSHQKIV